MGGLKGVLLRLRLVTVRFCLFGLCGECGRGRVVFLYWVFVVICVFVILLIKKKIDFGLNKFFF